jgi:hypothetical protein
MGVVAAQEADFAALTVRFGPRFVRSGARDRAAPCLRGLLGGTVRKDGWQLAEAAPYGVLST